METRFVEAQKKALGLALYRPEFAAESFKEARRRMNPHPSLEPFYALTNLPPFCSEEISEFCDLMKGLSEWEQNSIWEKYEKPVLELVKKRVNLEKYRKRIIGYLNNLPVRDKMLILLFQEVCALDGVNIDWVDDLTFFVVRDSEESVEIIEAARKDPETKAMVHYYDIIHEVTSAMLCGQDRA